MPSKSKAKQKGNDVKQSFARRHPAITAAALALTMGGGYTIGSLNRNSDFVQNIGRDVLGLGSNLNTLSLVPIDWLAECQKTELCTNTFQTVLCNAFTHHRNVQQAPTWCTGVVGASSTMQHAARSLIPTSPTTAPTADPVPAPAPTAAPTATPAPTATAGEVQFGPPGPPPG